MIPGTIFSGGCKTYDNIRLDFELHPKARVSVGLVAGDKTVTRVQMDVLF